MAQKVKLTRAQIIGIDFTLLMVALFAVLSISLKGVAPLQAPDHVARAVLLESNGKVIAAGRYFDGKALQFEIRKFERDGTPDPSFGNQGVSLLKIGERDDIAQGIAQQPDGKLWVVGRTHNGKNFDLVVARLKVDGTLDTEFAKNGMSITAFKSQNSVARNIALQSDGKAIVVGYLQKKTHYQFVAIRYLNNGTIDTSFAKQGKFIADFGTSNSGAVSVIALPDGKVLMGGCFYNGQSWDMAILRLLPDGKWDPSFGKEGKIIAPMSGTNDQVHLALQNDGKIVAAGNALMDDRFGFSLLRFNTDGSPDKSFGTEGKTVTAVGTNDAQPYSVALQKDGKIVAVGSSFIGAKRRFTIARFLPDGKIDTNFGTNGFYAPLIGSEHAVAKSVAIDDAGNIVAAGCAYHKKSFDFALARVNSQGTLEWHTPIANREIASAPIK